MNSASSNYFQSWIKEFFKPIILVYCSNKIREIFKKNNLKPAEYLRLIGDFSGMDLKIPFNEGTNSIITDFKFDFYDEMNFTKIKSTQKEDMFKICMDYNKPKWTLNSQIITKNNLDIINNKIKFYSFPWYIEFQKLFLECMAFNENDFYYQPLITVYMCSFDEDVKDIIIDEPDLIKEEIYRRTNNNVLIVLCDKNNDENKKIEEKIFEEIKNKFINNYKYKFHIIFNDINSNENINENFIKEKETNKNENNFNDENNNNNNINWVNYFHRTELYDNYNDYRRNKKKRIIFGKLISENDIKNLRLKFFDYIQNVYLTNVNNLIEKNSKPTNEGFIKNFFKKKKTQFNNKHPQIIKLDDNDFDSLFLSLNYFFFRNYSSCYKKLKDLKNSFINNNNNVQYSNFDDFYNINRYLGKEKKPQNLLSTLKTYSHISNFNIKESIRWFFIKTAIYEDNINIENPSNLIELIKDKTGITLINFNKNLKSRLNENNKKTISNTINFYMILYPLIMEKIICYYTCSYKYRKFVFYSVFVGVIYKKMNNRILNEYALNNFGNSLLFSNKVSNSFLNSRLNINSNLGEISNELNYIEGGFIFFKNCLELSIYNKNLKNTQSIFMTFYLNNKKKLIEKNDIKNNDNNSNILNIFRLNLPEIDNKSIFITEQTDYEIEKYSKNKNYINVKWDCFNKYIELIKSKPYCNLNEKDLLIIKNINNVILQKENSSNFHMRRIFYGNVNDYLYIKFKIINPLNIDIPIDSIKLDYVFTPENKLNNENNNNNDNNNNNNDNETNIKENDIKIKLNKNSYEIIELCITSIQPGQIYIKGVELNLYDNCKLYHSFNLKDKSRLYHYRNKLFNSEEYEKRRRKSSSNSSNSGNLSNNSKIHLTPVSKKTKLIYNIKSIDEDIYIKIPMGRELNLFQYQFVLFPIELINNSKNHRIKKFTIFFNDSIKYNNNNNNNIIKTTLLDYISGSKELFDEDNKITIFVPIFPQIIGEIFIKIVIKFEDELKYKNIEIKRFLIKLNVKSSFEFKVDKEIINYDNINNELNKIIFNVIFNGKNKNKNFYLKFENSFINKSFNILNNNNNNNNSKIVSNKKNNENKIYYKLMIEQNLKNYVKKNNENQINLDFICENKKIDIDYILNKLSNILNKSNYLMIEWEYIKKEDNNNNKTNNTENNNNFNNEKKIFNNDKIKGLFFYDIEITKPKIITTDFIKNILFNSVKKEINQIKINNEETLININFILNKKGLMEFKNIIKYEIFIKDEDYRIIWLGLTKFSIINSPSENDVVNIDFNFITKYKGFFLIDQIGVLFHEKIKNNYNIINIKNITKPEEIIIN